MPVSESANVAAATPWGAGSDYERDLSHEEFNSKSGKNVISSVASALSQRKQFTPVLGAYDLSVAHSASQHPDVAAVWHEDERRKRIADGWRRVFESHRSANLYKSLDEVFHSRQNLEIAVANRQWRYIPLDANINVVRRRTIEENVSLDERMRTLRALATEDEALFSSTSEAFARAFIIEQRLISPKIALTSKGYIRAVWKNGELHLEVDFLEEDRLSVLLIRSNDQGGSGRYVAEDLEALVYKRWSDVFHEFKCRS